MFKILKEGHWLSENGLWGIEYRVVLIRKTGTYSQEIWVTRRNTKGKHVRTKKTVPRYVKEMIDKYSRKCKEFVARLVEDREAQILTAKAENNSWQTVLTLGGSENKTFYLNESTYVIRNDFYNALIVNEREHCLLEVVV
ncbi:MULTISPECIES: hypothetical protein [unclassified Lysinibacillus]|uniref:hypothetical protein n=1 Tax=unclassified Lysinibacillus TaxID=2636778 RepID=UPI003811EAD1